MITVTTVCDGNLVVTTHLTMASASASLRDNFDGLGELDRVPDEDLPRALLDTQGILVTITTDRTLDQKPSATDTVPPPARRP